MNPGHVVMELSRLGFRFRLEGEAVKVRFEGKQTPETAAVSPLLAVVKEHKEEVSNFLNSYCPRCGGMVFGTFNGESRCLACYYAENEGNRR